MHRLIGNSILFNRDYFFTMKPLKNSVLGTCVWHKTLLSINQAILIKWHLSNNSNVVQSALQAIDKSKEVTQDLKH